MSNKTVAIKVGAVTYKSLSDYHKSAVRMAEKRGDKTPTYMTLYMRVRAGMSPAKAMAVKVREYNKKEKA